MMKKPRRCRRGAPLFVYNKKKMLYMTVWAIKHRTFVNNFAYETAEINIEVKHLLRSIKRNRPNRIG